MIPTLHFTTESLQSYLHDIYPHTANLISVEELSPHHATIRLFIQKEELRPGGTISGPTLFTAADCAFYCALLGMIGPKPLAVTSNVSISFYRKPKPVDVIGKARILKLGRVLAMGDCLIYSDKEETPVAQASVTYAIPSDQSA